MKYLIYIFVIVQVCLVYGQDGPEIVKISRAQEVNIGDSAEFTCRVANVEKYPVVWLKDGGSKKLPKQLSIGAELTVEDDRYTLKFDRTKGTYHLKIDDVRQKDTGLYRCEIQISATKVVSAEVALNLIVDASK